MEPARKGVVIRLRLRRAVSVWNIPGQPPGDTPRGRAKKPHLVPSAEWWSLLRVDPETGKPVPTSSNAIIIIANDPDLSGLLAFNEFSSRAVILHSPPSTAGGTTVGPFPRAWEEADRVFVLAYFQRSYNSRFKMDVIAASMLAAAALKRFHPVRDYLDGLIWDEQPRIGSWLSDAFGAALDPYHHAVASKFLVAAVKRIRHPGCKFDSMMVLEGSQDIGKSRACRALFGSDWFSDTLPADVSGRDISDALQGLWGIEFAEIEHLLRSEPETIKAFLSRQVDRYRPSYGRTQVERPRQCIFVGTTNQDDYARDSTGNRRLWPVRCDFVDVGWIEKWRDQLWAEANHRSESASLWLDDSVAREAAIQQQAARQDEDPWTAPVHSFVRPSYGRTQVERPRQCIFVGTTNQDDYARDSTGNRRLWSVRCDFVDVGWIEKWRGSALGRGESSQWKGVGACGWMTAWRLREAAAVWTNSRQQDRMKILGLRRFTHLSGGASSSLFQRFWSNLCEASNRSPRQARADARGRHFAPDGMETIGRLARSRSNQEVVRSEGRW